VLLCLYCTGDFFARAPTVFCVLNKQEIKQKASAPGPGYYNLPAAIKVDEKPAKVQNFSSSGERFRDVSLGLGNVRK
jgi:hypothetical protein